MNRRMKLALAVLAAALVLSAGAVFLLSGSGNGYETVFKAGVKSLTDTESVTMDGFVTVWMNGEKLEDREVKYLADGLDSYERETDRLDEDDGWECYEVDGTGYNSIDHENKTYETYKAYASSYGYEDDGENNGEDTIVKIVKLFADFYMGNAKNQFVREPLADANRYVIHLKREQLPDLVSLFIDLFNEGGLFFPTDTYRTVEYEDRMEAMRAYHLKKCGEVMDENVFELYYKNTLLQNAYYEFQNEMLKEYERMGEEAGENYYVYVLKDGTAEIYPSRKQMYIDRLSQGKPLSGNMSALDYPANADIEYVHAEFDVSEEGYITRIYFKGEASVDDVIGKTNTAVVEMCVNLSDYNQTHIELFSLDEYREKEKEDQTVETVAKTRTVKFLGKKYFVYYKETVEDEE